MKITKRQLRRIIKEEKRKVLNEQASVSPEEVHDAVLDAVYGIMLNLPENLETKRAIAAGIKLLQKKAGIDTDDIEQVLLAGAFGNYIRPVNAVRMGLLPNVPLEKIHFVGNAAGAGAQIVLTSTKCRDISVKLARRIEYVEIAHESEFQMVFAESLMFEKVHSS